MAEGLLPAGANTALDALLAAYPWVKLHVGAPGAAGTANPAVETDRKQGTYAASSGGASSNTNALQWTGVDGTEDYTHVSFWSASAAGTGGLTGVITANPVVTGDTFTIAIGDLDISFPLAS
jgi:hypothetical protein